MRALRFRSRNDTKVRQPDLMSNQFEPQAAAHSQVVSDSLATADSSTTSRPRQRQCVQGGDVYFGVDRRRVRALMPQQFADLIQRASLPKQARG